MTVLEILKNDHNGKIGNFPASFGGIVVSHNWGNDLKMKRVEIDQLKTIGKYSGN